MIWLILAGALLGGFGRRVAGGLFEPLKGKSFIARGFVTHLIYAVALGSAAGIGIWASGDLGRLWWFAVATGVGAFAGHSLGLHHSLSMGRYPSHPGGPNDLFSWRLFALHFCGMSAYGLAVLITPVVISTWLNDWCWTYADCVLDAASLTTAPVYALFYLVQDRVGPIRFNPPEWITGACYGIACALVMP